MFTEDFLRSIARKELQTIAKENGLKANGSSDTIIRLLLESQTSSPQVDDTPAETIEVKEKKILEKGDSAFGFIDETWVDVIIKRVNKNSIRVATLENVEITLELDMVVSEKPKEVVWEDDVHVDESPPDETSEEVKEPSEEVASTDTEIDEPLLLETVVDRPITIDQLIVDDIPYFKTTKTQQLRQSANIKRIESATKVSTI